MHITRVEGGGEKVEKGFEGKGGGVVVLCKERLGRLIENNECDYYGRVKVCQRR